MLERTISPKEANSRFYLHNEGLVKEWECFIDARGGMIEGEVNSFFISFKANYQVGLLNIRIEGLRQLSNNVAENIYSYVMTKSTDVCIEGKTHRAQWTIRKKKWWLDMLYSLTIRQVVPLPQKNNYVLVCKDNVDMKHPQKVLRQACEIAEVRDVKQANGKLYIRFHNFLGPLSVRKLINSLI